MKGEIKFIKLHWEIDFPPKMGLSGSPKVFAAPFSLNYKGAQSFLRSFIDDIASLVRKKIYSAATNVYTFPPKSTAINVFPETATEPNTGAPVACFQANLPVSLFTP